MAQRKQTLGASIDQLWSLRKRIQDCEKEARELKAEFSQIETKLLRDFGDEGIDGSKGGKAVASIRTAKFPTIKNRAKLERFILKNRALDLFQNRLSSKAYFDRLENGEDVPGVEVFERVGISLRKRTK